MLKIRQQLWYYTSTSLYCRIYQSPLTVGGGAVVVGRYWNVAVAPPVHFNVEFDNTGYALRCALAARFMHKCSPLQLRLLPTVLFNLLLLPLWRRVWSLESACWRYSTGLGRSNGKNLAALCARSGMQPKPLSNTIQMSQLCGCHKLR